MVWAAGEDTRVDARDAACDGTLSDIEDLDAVADLERADDRGHADCEQARVAGGDRAGSSLVDLHRSDHALAVERSQQTTREGGAKRYREMKTRSKTPKGG